MKRRYKGLIVATSLIAGVTAINRAIFKFNKNLPNPGFQLNFYKFKYGNIHYNVYGEGEPLLLIHDTSIGSSYKEWENSIKSLSNYYKVYVIDLLGFGASSAPAISYSSYLYVTLINSFIEDVIKEKAYVAASSNSAAFAVIASLFNSDNFKKLILVSPTGIKKTFKVKSYSKFLCKLMESPILGTTIYNIISSKYSLRKYLYTHAYYNPLNVTNSMVDNYNHMAHLRGKNLKYSASAYISGYLYVDIAPHLEKTTVPTHIVWGADYELNTQENADFIKELNPNINISIIEESKLLPHNEKPKEFYKVCRAFFS